MRTLPPASPRPGVVYPWATGAPEKRFRVYQGHVTNRRAKNAECIRQNRRRLAKPTKECTGALRNRWQNVPANSNPVPSAPVRSATGDRCTGGIMWNRMSPDGPVVPLTPRACGGGANSSNNLHRSQMGESPVRIITTPVDTTIGALRGAPREAQNGPKRAARRPRHHGALLGPSGGPLGTPQ